MIPTEVWLHVMLEGGGPGAIATDPGTGGDYILYRQEGRIRIRTFPPDSLPGDISPRQIPDGLTWRLFWTKAPKEGGHEYHRFAPPWHW